MTLAWTAHPAKRRPQDAMLAACVIAVATYAVLVGLQSGWLAAVAAIILVVAIAPFLLPTHYRLDTAGVSERRLYVTRTRAWTTVRRVDVGRSAALVSPYATRRWLDRYRGITIYFDGGERDAVLQMIFAHVPQ